MKTKLGINWPSILLTVCFIAFVGLTGLQSQKSRPNVLFIKTATDKTVPIVLPDSTLAKIDTIAVREKTLDSLLAVEKKITISNQTVIKKLETQSKTIDRIGYAVSKTDKVEKLPTREFSPSQIRYPDSIKIVTEERKSGFFDRIFNRRN